MKLLTLLSSICLIILFQNCDKGYRLTASGDSNNSIQNSTASPGHPGLPGAPTSFSSSDCNMPYPAFAESDVLAAFSPQGTVTVNSGMTVSIWYSDEQAMTLGIREVVDIAADGAKTTTSFSVSPLLTIPSMQVSPEVGATDLTGDLAGTDVSGRPIWPALFITDTTSNSASTAGDWQNGGTPISPSVIYGTWKSAVRTVDHTKSPAVVTVTPDQDPATNNFNFGHGIQAPPGITSEGYGSVVSWDVGQLGLQSGHTYRLQFMVHDGDQNKTGGDAGENCVNLVVP